MHATEPAPSSDPELRGRTRAGEAEGVLCRAPFASMEFTPDGSVLTCCANYLHPIGLVGEQRLRDMWRGPAAERLRNAIRRGDLSLGCAICRHRIRHHGAELPLLAYEHYEVDDLEWPTSLTFSLHNTCNLECAMCGADRSSRIRTRRLGLPPLPQRYPESFYEEIREFVAHASCVDFVGGEPLLIPGHWRIWDIMREVAPGQTCAITTNGTIWNGRVERLLADFPTSIRMSMDGMTRSTFESIRIGADFDEFLVNVERYRTYVAERGTSMSIAWSFIRQNWFELGDALVWAEERGISVYVTTVLERDFGVQHLPVEDLSRVLESMLRQDEQVRPHLALNLGAWERQLDMVATALADRIEHRPTEVCFDAPTIDGARRAAERMTSVDLADRAERELPDLASYASAWGLRLDLADRLVFDAAGLVLAHRPGDSGVLGDVVPGVDSLERAIQLLCEGVGGSLWRLEDLSLPDAFVMTVGVGPEERNGDDLVTFRFVVTPHRLVDGAREVVVVGSTRGGHLAGSPVSITSPIRLA